jgi:hypothetical protein
MLVSHNRLPKMTTTAKFIDVRATWGVCAKMRLILLLISGLLLTGLALAKHTSQHPLSPQEWKEVEARVGLLENAALMPSLLPFVMRNRDALQLTDEQIATFYRWRKENFVSMVNLMNAIIEKKVEFSTESLSPEVSDEHLLAFQIEIQQLQQTLLELRLSCRRLIMDTFTEEQWENFVFIAADDPKLAGFLSLPANMATKHNH